MKLISHEKLYKYNSINIYIVALSYPFVHLHAIKTEFMVSPDLQTFLAAFNSTFNGHYSE